MLTLPRSLLAELDRLARERRGRRAGLLREAVSEFLERDRAERVAREMADYADAMSESSGEFVRETGDHVAARLLEDSEW